MQRTKEALNELEECLTSRLDDAEKERASLEERLTQRIDRSEDKVRLESGRARGTADGALIGPIWQLVAFERARSFT